MKKLLLASCVAGLAFAAAPAHADAVWDAQGDWAPGYTGQHLADLDVKWFGVVYDSGIFHIKATMFGNITAGTEGFYVIGVNTGTGPSHPFGPIGAPDVKFNNVFFVQKNGTGNIGATSLTPFITIAGDSFWVDLPASVIPAGTAAPLNYTFNLWPRGAGAQAVADFAPDNSMLAAVPEIGTWAMMIAGFAAVGSGMRFRRRRPAFA
ncbi:MAG: hypothetical protein J7494_14145 [Sphingobium sp.]|nr:hypothetical protein [Sphingobium sp.]